MSPEGQKREKLKAMQNKSKSNRNVSCKVRKKNNNYLVWLKIHLSGWSTHRFLTQQKNRNIYSERAKGNNGALEKLTMASGR